MDKLDTFRLVQREVQVAVAKFSTWPTDPFHAYAVLSEEYGELGKALVQFVYEPHKGVTLEGIREEAVQTAAMAMRFIESIDRYDYRRSQDHLQPMILGVRAHDAP